MLPNSYIKVSYTFTIIGLIAESALKFINDTRYISPFGMQSLKRKAFPYLFLLLNTFRSLQQLRIALRGSPNLVLVCNDTGKGHGKKGLKNKVF